MVKPAVWIQVIYNWINSNRRDSPIWQRGFLTAGGAEKLKEFWDEEGSDQDRDGLLQLEDELLDFFHVGLSKHG